MRILIYLFTFCVAFYNGNAQTLLTDKEHLFTSEEIYRIDSMLQNYYKTSGNLIVVCTDTLDVSTKTYKDSLISLYTGNLPNKPYAVFLLLSRKNSIIQLESNDLSKDSSEKKDTIDLVKVNAEKPPSIYPTNDTKERLDDFMKIVSYGVPALKEKKREEGVMIICKKAMEFLNALPKRELNK
jgi:hypothetical protein